MSVRKFSPTAAQDERHQSLRSCVGIGPECRPSEIQDFGTSVFVRNALIEEESLVVQVHELRNGGAVLAVSWNELVGASPVHPCPTTVNGVPWSLWSNSPVN